MSNNTTLTVANVQYSIDRKLNEGGTAQTYVLQRRGNNLAGPERYILKTLKEEYKDDPVLKEVLRREYNIGQTLQTPYIAKYIAYRPAIKSIIIEFIDGITLKQFLTTEEGRTYFNTNQYHHIYDFCKQVIDGIIQMHKHRIYHCDLTPNNIILMRNTNQAVIIDMGMARTDGDCQCIGSTVGRQAPEMRFGMADNRSDIYMFGLILKDICSDNVLFSPIANKCTQENPKDRYQSVDELYASVHDIYCERADEDLMNAFNNDQETIHIVNSKLYSGEKFICNIEDSKFCRNNAYYLELISIRQQCQQTLNNAYAAYRKDDLAENGEDDDEDYDERLHQEKLAYEAAQEPLNAVKIRIFTYEQDILKLSCYIKESRFRMSDENKQQVYNLILSGKLNEAKQLIRIDEVNSNMNQIGQNIQEMNEAMKKNLNYVLLYAKIAVVDLSDKNRINTTLSALDTMLTYSTYLPEKDRDFYYEQYGNMIVYDRLTSPNGIESLKKHAEMLSREHHPSPALVKLFFDLTDVYRINKDYTLAEACQQQAITYINTFEGEHNNLLRNELLAKAYIQKARIQKDKRAYGEALLSISTSLKYAEDLANQMANEQRDAFLTIQLICDIYNLSGDIHKNNKNNNQAVASYKKVIDINEKYKDQMQPDLYASCQGEAYKCLADVYIMSGEVESGRSAYRKSLDFFDKDGQYHIQDLRSIAYAANELATSLINHKDCTESIQLFDKAKALVQEYANYYPNDEWVDEMNARINNNRSLIDFFDAL